MGFFKTIGSGIVDAFKWELNLNKKIASAVAAPVRWEYNLIKDYYTKPTDSEAKAQVARAISEGKIEKGNNCFGDNAYKVNHDLVYTIGCTEEDKPHITIARYQPYIPLIAGSWKRIEVTEADFKTHPALAGAVRCVAVAESGTGKSALLEMDSGLQIP